mmetsp:Transcript_4233/g.6404  ORF Transcript_4233/g.6404 Transcript_4233/m.6404 type:complete len:460 (-) Transcript_4233:113-1492(-)
MEELVINKACFVQNFVCKIEDKYQITQKLGEGTYGAVYLGSNKQTGVVRAIKHIPKSMVTRPERLDNEVKLMMAADHPNIAKIFEVIEDRRNIYLVLEHCSGGELFDYIIEKQHLTETEAASLFRQVMLAISHLHSMEITHRDLKPENLMFSEKSTQSPLKLIDFGLARMTRNQELMTSRAGTPFYISPEVLKGSYDKKTDVWSAGVILYIMLCGYPPFHSNSDSEVFSKVMQGSFNFRGKEWRSVSKQAKQLIRQMLTLDNSKRPSAEQVLQHPWLKDPLPREPLSLDVKSLTSFTKARKFRKAVLLCIASQCSEQDISDLRKTFMSLDREGKGYATLEDFQTAVGRFSRTLGNDVHALLQSLDVNRNGTIDYTEFLAATLDKSTYLQQEKLYGAFKTFDKNNTGVISVDDLKRVLGSHEMMQSEFLKSIISEADVNRDGVIDYNDFLQFMNASSSLF